VIKVGFRWVSDKKVVIDKFWLDKMVEAYYGFRMGALDPDFDIALVTKDYEYLKNKSRQLEAQNDQESRLYDYLQAALQSGIVPEGSKEKVRQTLFDRLVETNGIDKILKDD
jgi:hypothetical protein